MKILITGGAGYLGTELTISLAENPNVTEIIIYDNLSRKNLNFFLGQREGKGEKVKFILGDLLDSRKLKSALKGVETVYHLAAKVTTPFADEGPHSFEQVNQWGTAELTYLLEDSEVKNLIFASSISVYGASSAIIPEDKEPNPRTYYGISKYLGEEMIQRLLGGKINTYIVRCANIYGHSKSMRFDSVINKFMFEANFQNRIQVQGNGEQKRSFVSVDQAVHAFTELLKAEVPEGIYNLASANYSINELAEEVQNLYPEMETMHVQQSLTLRSLFIDTASGLAKHGLIKASALKDDLLKIKEGFAF